MPAFGASTYLTIGEALGEAIYKTDTLTAIQANNIMYTFANVIALDNPGFKLEQFIEQVTAYLELARHTASLTPDFEETQD